MRVSRGMGRTAMIGTIQTYVTPFALSNHELEVMKELYYESHPHGDFLQYQSTLVQFDLPERMRKRGVLFPAVNLIPGEDGEEDLVLHEVRPPSYLSSSVADNTLRFAGIGFLGMPQNISGRSGTFAYLLLGLKTYYRFLDDLPECIVSAEVQNVDGVISDDVVTFTLRQIGDGDLKRQACSGMSDHHLAIFDATPEDFIAELRFLEPFGFSFFPRNGYVFCSFSIPMPELEEYDVENFDPIAWGFHEHIDRAALARGTTSARPVYYARGRPSQVRNNYA